MKTKISLLALGLFLIITFEFRISDIKSKVREEIKYEMEQKVDSIIKEDRDLMYRALYGEILKDIIDIMY